MLTLDYVDLLTSDLSRSPGKSTYLVTLYYTLHNNTFIYRLEVLISLVQYLRLHQLVAYFSHTRS